MGLVTEISEEIRTLLDFDYPFGQNNCMGGSTVRHCGVKHSYQVTLSQINLIKCYLAFN